MGLGDSALTGHSLPALEGRTLSTLPARTVCLVNRRAYCLFLAVYATLETREAASGFLLPQDKLTPAWPLGYLLG